MRKKTHTHLKNTVTGKELHFDGFNGPYALQQAIDFGTVQGEPHTTPFITLNGEKINNVRLEPRDIKINGYVFAKNQPEMMLRKAFLNRFFNVRQDIDIYYQNHKITMRPDNTIRYSTDKWENNAVFCVWTINGTAHLPLWSLIQRIVLFDSKIQGVPLFPLIIPADKGFAFGFVPARSTRNPVNAGDINVGFVFILTAEFGSVLNPKIINNKTGHFIELMLSMDMGDSVTISTVSGEKGVRFRRRNVETDIIRAVTLDSTMGMFLNTGENDLTITAAENATNLSSVLALSPLWNEVQE